MSYLQSRKCEERDNVTRCWQWRQIDGNPPKYDNTKRTLENAAEDHLVNKETLEERSCEVPGVPKSTFLMVFSPDGTRVASTHGNHNIYLSDLSTGKHIKTLTGHPRTPWCITFHPSKPRLLASGCLGGQVRVWDLDGGSEVWSIENEIASIAFHPQDQMLVVASFNELFFWDWKHSKPYIKVRTSSIKEKVRFVAFDSLGHKLITGICINNSNPASVLNSNNFSGIPYLSHNNNNNNNNQGDDNVHPAHVHPQMPSHPPSEAMRERLAQGYENLINQYRQLLADAPIPAHTIDRGTDPMEVDNMHYLPQFRGMIPRPPQPVVVRRIPFYVQYSGNVNRPNNVEQDASNDEYLPMHSFPRPPQVEPAANANTNNSNDPEANNTPSHRIDSVINQVQSYLRERMEFRRQLSTMNPVDNNGSAERNVESRPAAETSQSQRLESNDPPAEGESSNNSSYGHVYLHIDNDDRLFSSRQSAFLPLVGTRQEEERTENPPERPNIPNNPNNPRPRSQQSTSEALPLFRDAALRTARTEFTASLHRIHGFMETSIDDTLNYWDRYANGPRPSHIEVLREYPTRRFPNNPTPTAHAANTNSIPTAHASNSNPMPNHHPNIDPTNSSARTSTPERFNLNRNSIDSQLERELRPDRPYYEIIRDLINAGNRLYNLFNEPNERLPPLQEMSIMELNSLLHPGNQSTSNPSTGEPRAAFFSSDDDSDGDREMFSPLPGRIYVNRNVLENSVPTRSVPQLVLRAFFPPSAPAASNNPNSQQNNSNVNRSNNPENLITSNNQNEDHQYYVRNSSNDTNNTFPSNDIRNPYLNMNRNESNPSQGPSSNPGPSQQFDHGIEMPDDVPLNSENRETLSSIAFQKVTTSVKLLENHTEKLIFLWASKPSQPPIDQIIKTWDDLKKDIVALDNTTGNIDAEQFLRERLQNQPSTSASPPSSSNNADGSNDANSSDPDTAESNPDTSPNAQNNSLPDDDEDNLPSTSTGIRNSQNPRPGQVKTYPPSKRSNTRRPGPSEEPNPMTRKKMRSFIMNTMNRSNTSQKWQNILQLRSSVKRRLNRNPSETTQQSDINALRATVRMKARTILGFMFNMMIHCLEAEQLGNLIVNMLRSLKKSITITCVLLLSSSSSANAGADSDNLSENNSEYESDADDSSRLNSAELAGNSLVGVTSEWSDRIAVQISAVNRNNSTTAHNRRESYNKMCSSWRSSLINSNSQNPRRRRKRRSSKKIINTTKRLKLGITKPSTSNLPPQPTRPNIPIPPNIPTHAIPSLYVPPPHERFQRRFYQHPFSPARQAPNPPPQRQTANAFPQRQSANPSLQRLILNPAHVEQMGDVSYVRRLWFIRNRMNFRRNIMNIHRDRWIPRSSNSVIVPTVRVNDVPVSEMNQHAAPEGGSRFSAPRVAEFIQPVFVPNLVVSDDNMGIGIIDPGIQHVENHPMSRIQVWNFSEGEVPDLRNTTKNIVVSQCKILNDASVDISKDGQLLVALIPPPNTRSYGSLSHRLGIYSLDWNCLGDCLYYTLLEQNAVSVSLSPCARHLAVGLSTKRVNLQSYGRNGIMALIFRLGNSKHKDAEGNGGLIPVRTLEQSSEIGLTSLNCLRWAPQPGQGLLYANNVGQLKILS